MTLYVASWIILYCHDPSLLSPYYLLSVYHKVTAVLLVSLSV